MGYLGQAVPAGKEPPPELVAKIKAAGSKLPDWANNYSPEFLAYVCIKQPIAPGKLYSDMCVLNEIDSGPSILEPITGIMTDILKIPGKVIQTGLPTVNLLLIVGGLFFLWRLMGSRE